MSDSSMLYQVNSYTSFYNSYLASLIPSGSAKAYIDFLTRLYLTNGPIRGAVTRLSAFLSKDVVINTTREDVKALINNFLDEVMFKEKQTSLYQGVLVFDEVALVYLPKEVITMTCTSCDHSFNIDSTYNMLFTITSLTDIDKEYSSVKKDSSLPQEKRRTIPKTFGIQCVCPSCGSRFKAKPRTSIDTDTPGVLTIINPLLVETYTNDAGLKFMRINPEEYDGVLSLDTELEYFHIEGLTWNLAVTYASKEVVHYPDRQYYEVFSFNDICSIGAGASVSPLVSTISDLMHIEVLKRGNEAVAMSKINPLYLLSPMEPSPSSSTASRFSTVNESIYRNFILEQVKQHQEGDLNRIVYSNIPVSSNPLFGDGRRFITLQEVAAYSSNVVASLGVTPDALSGSTGIINDPFTLEVMNNLSDKIQRKLIRMLNSIFVKHIPGYTTLKKENSGVIIEMEKVSSSRGTVDYQTVSNLVSAAALPKSDLLKYVGKRSYRDTIRQINEEKIIENEEAYKAEVKARKIQNDQLMRNSDIAAAQGTVDTTTAKNTLISQAEQIINEQLVNMQDQGQIKSFFVRLKQEDPVLHAVVKEKWNDFKDMAQQ